MEGRRKGRRRKRAVSDLDGEGEEEGRKEEGKTKRKKKGLGLNGEREGRRIMLRREEEDG